MNHSISKSRLFVLNAIGVAAIILTTAGAHAQDITTTHTRQGEPMFETNVKNAEVVYVEGNNLVVKLDNGKVEHMIVPFNEKFSIDGRELTVSQLRPGTKLTQTITTTTTPHYVKTVRTLKGKVWHVQGPRSVIVTLPDHTNVRYEVPAHATFNVDGKAKTVFELRKGMAFDATIVTEEPHSVVQMSKVSVGKAPAPALELPTFQGVMLFQSTVQVPVEKELSYNVAAYHVDTLPETASQLPAVGLLGFLSIASTAGLAAVRKAIRLNV